MFANIQDWKSDTKREADGVPLDLGRGRSIVLRRAGGSNRAFTVALAELIRGVVGERDPQDVADSEIDGQLKALYADHVVVDWVGFQDEAGDAIPYTRAAFLELMELAPDMWLRVRTTANSREHFQTQLQARALDRDREIIKKSSRGKRNGAHTAHA